MEKHESPAGVAGVGIDLVAIGALKDLDEKTGHSFTARTFTKNEKQAAEKSPDPYEYYAGRYAVKEAVFKAISSRCSEPFDFRTIETLNDETGKPCVVMSPELRKICEDACISRILVSISHEGGLAIAIAEALEKP